MDTDELELMGYNSDQVQPSKHLRTSSSSVSLFEVKPETQKLWSEKWLSYRRYVLQNPLELSSDATKMKHSEYSEKIIQYLNRYRVQDPEFAELAIQLVLMLPASSTSEHLFSIANIQARPNTKFPTLAARTLVASNAGFLMNGVM